MGWWVEVSTEEFCVKVQKFEIVNTWNLFIYFSEIVPRTIEIVPPVLFSLGGLKIGFKMAHFKIDRTTLDLLVKIRDCWVLVGPYPLCTPTSAVVTGGVGNLNH